jgi:hypothetical protein
MLDAVALPWNLVVLVCIALAFVCAFILPTPLILFLSGLKLHHNLPEHCSLPSLCAGYSMSVE